MIFLRKYRVSFLKPIKNASVASFSKTPKAEFFTCPQERLLKASVIFHQHTETFTQELVLGFLSSTNGCLCYPCGLDFSAGQIEHSGDRGFSGTCTDTLSPSKWGGAL